MELKNKTDKKLKKYLKSVCEDLKESKIYNSIHYGVSINGVVKHIRFSDHISIRAQSKLFIDIIKVTDSQYQIWFDNGSKHVVSDDILVDYVKGYILVANQFEAEAASLRISLSKAEAEINKLHKSELALQVEFLKSELIIKTNVIATLEETAKKRNAEIKRLNNKIELYRQFENNITKLKNFLNNNYTL